VGPRDSPDVLEDTENTLPYRNLKLVSYSTEPGQYSTQPGQYSTQPG